MSIPSFNIPNFVTLYQPPNYRLPKWLMYLQSLVSGLTWRKAVFDAYRNGDTQPVYEASAVYPADAAVYWNYGTYQSLIPGNVGNQPDISPSAWTPRCGSFIGATERVKYKGGNIYLTFQLNRVFNSTFRQPPWPAPYDYGLGGGTWSDIYITELVPSFISLALGTSPQNLGLLGTRPTTLGLGTIYIDMAASSYQFVINIPLAVYNAIGVNDAIRTSVVTRIASKWIAAGTSFEISTY